MSSKSEVHLRHILENAQIVREYLEGQTLASYQADRKTRDAVERRLQNLSEAVFRLKEQATILCPNIDWRDIRGLGNFLRHEYEKVSDEHLWEKMHRSLPEIEVAVTAALKTLHEPEELE